VPVPAFAASLFTIRSFASFKRQARLPRLAWCTPSSSRLRASWIASEEDAPALSRKEFSRDLLPASVPFEISSGLGGWTVRGDAEFGLALSILSIMEEAWLTRSFVEERRRFSRVRDDADDVLGTVPVSSSIEGGVGEGWAEGGGVIHDAREHDGGSNEISIGGSGENVGERDTTTRVFVCGETRTGEYPACQLQHARKEKLALFGGLPTVVEDLKQTSRRPRGIN
jgi:hypothetical protein